jgi:hypothetical protein
MKHSLARVVRWLHVSGRVTHAPVILPSWLLTIALGVALVGACGDPESGKGIHGRGLYVRATWQDARGVVGHRVHVVEHKLACSECHDLSGKEVDRPSSRVCAARCHADEVTIDHALGPARAKSGDQHATADCLACHAFVPTGTGGDSPDAWSCMRCHAAQQGKTPAVSIHKQSTCDSCHRPHERPSVEPSECEECHESVAPTHGGGDKSAAQVCTTCHRSQHASAASARASCQPCHAQSEPRVPASALFEGHKECSGCHRPHAEQPEQAVPCRECHADTPVLGGGSIAAHTACDSCHQPHAVGKGMVDACAKCHGASATDHPAKPGGACASCHDMHPALARTAVARSCSNCHQDAASDTAFHGKTTSCRDCHRPHRFVAAARDPQVCSSCHGSQVLGARSVKGHAACTSCHAGLPHRPGAISATCGSCHAAVLSAAHPKHRDCRSCHEPHGGDVVAACGTCHADEQRLAPAGHQDCKSCHEPHGGRRRPLASCTSCHASQATSIHGNVGGSCASCHSAHGPKGSTHAPACATCHDTKRLPALHGVAQHGDCNRCHRSHSQPAGRHRATCLSCHADRQGHFPDAPRCTSCHLFE